MNESKVPYAKQIFVCTNDRRHEKPSCGDHHAEEIFTELRKIAKDKGLHPKIRVAQAKCLGQCSIGTNIMIYPDNIWYSRVELAHVKEIAEKHIA